MIFERIGLITELICALHDESILLIESQILILNETELIANDERGHEKGDGIRELEYDETISKQRFTPTDCRLCFDDGNRLKSGQEEGRVTAGNDSNKE